MATEKTPLEESDNRENSEIQEHYKATEVISMLQPIVTMMAAQEERLSKKIDDQEQRTIEKIHAVHKDVNRINGSVAQAHKDIAEIKSGCALRGQSCNLQLENVKNARWIIDRLAEMSRRPKTAVVLFIIFVIATQVLVLEATQNGWLGKIWEYIRLIF